MLIVVRNTAALTVWHYGALRFGVASAVIIVAESANVPSSMTAQ